VKALEPYSSLIDLSYHCSETRRHADSRDGAGGTAEAPLRAMNQTIDRVIKTAVFSRCNLISCGEMAEQQ
jgi:hypothetical protein